MSEDSHPAGPADLLVELGARRGLTLDRPRAEALRAPLDSLLVRLARLARSLPSDAMPAPTPRARGGRAGS